MAVLMLGAVSDSRDERGQWPLPPPRGPWPETGTFSAFLCDSKDQHERCRDGGSATAAERQEVEKVLAGMPEIKDFRFESREDAFANMRTIPELAAVLKPDDLSESYRGVLRPGDWRSVLKKLESLEGISNVFAFRDSFWWGKADISIDFCADVNAFVKHCEGRGQATEAEKQAVLDRIREVRGIEKIYVEDRPHAAKVHAHAWWKAPPGSGGRLDEIGEAFYVKLAEPGAVARIKGSVEGMAGVGRVVEVATS
ncbi:permease-like cell division protein FtsX [Microtetraspora malaysiensis]|uniref:permease-like cell division protein FtsX n=1 Tax=Microtetraspora malaysiensis TaxID=161358 RepID=UPI003D8AE1C4